MSQPFFEPTQEAGAALFRRNIAGEVVMLNLLRFRDVADYSATPELAPDEPRAWRTPASLSSTSPTLLACWSWIRLLV